MNGFQEEIIMADIGMIRDHALEVDELRDRVVDVFVCHNSPSGMIPIENELLV